MVCHRTHPAALRLHGQHERKCKKPPNVQTILTDQYHISFAGGRSGDIPVDNVVPADALRAVLRVHSAGYISNRPHRGNHHAHMPGTYQPSHAATYISWGPRLLRGTHALKCSVTCLTAVATYTLHHCCRSTTSARACCCCA